ncbi:hypothetical protein ACVWWO_006353 [Bradyrhizobium sp. F1.13.1]
MCMYLVLYKTDLFDLNAVVQDATGSSWFPVFIFVCVLLESVFPYFGYFPATALILMSVALNPKPADVPVFIVAWSAIIAGAVLSYGQARFFRPLLQRVASKAALNRCESLLDAYGPYARIALFVHPNACAMYFTALGLLGPQPDARTRLSRRGGSSLRGRSVRRREQTCVVRRHHRRRGIAAAAGRSTGCHRNPGRSLRGLAAGAGGLKLEEACASAGAASPLAPSLRAQRSNPVCLHGKTLDCFATLAMTRGDHAQNKELVPQGRWPNTPAQATATMPSCRCFARRVKSDFGKIAWL